MNDFKELVVADLDLVTGGNAQSVEASDRENHPVQAVETSPSNVIQSSASERGTGGGAHNL